MYTLRLNSPIFLESQLNNICGSTEYSIEYLRALADHIVPSHRIVTEAVGRYQQFDLVPLVVKKRGEPQFASLPKDLPVSHTLTGSHAIAWMFRQKGIQIQPLESIRIPVSVFSRCTPGLWYDISTIFAMVKNRNDRLGRFKLMNAPDIIIYAEEKMLWKAVEMLESTYVFGTPLYRPDGTATRGLNTIGYSLLTGWDDPELDEE